MWGSNNAYGQLGRPGDDFAAATVAITEIVSIDAGWEHSLAVTSGGNLYGWGMNEEYQVLVSDYMPVDSWEVNLTQPTPTLILAPPQGPNWWDAFITLPPPPLLTGIVAASASQKHSMVITSDGGYDSVVAWGINGLEGYNFCETTPPYDCTLKIAADFRGTLGLANIRDTYYAQSPLTSSLMYVPDLPATAPLWGSNNTVNVVTIATGRQHSLALREDGTVYTSGNNYQYQLGNNPGTEYISTPAAVQLINMTCETSGIDFEFNVYNPPVDCDFDGDGVSYATDNCPSVSNPDQADADSNGIGNACNDPCSALGGDSDNDEICGDGVDNDCDYLIDTNDPDCPADDDGDGYDVTVDCNDNDAAINSGATEVCADGKDNDCDYLIDTNDPDCPADDDGDGYDVTVDCNDNDAAINSGATEVCEDGQDNNCDGLTDIEDIVCTPICEPTSRQEKGGKCYDGIDNDCDGLMDNADPDCFKKEGKGKTCSDGIDNDGDLLIDCADFGCLTNKTCGDVQGHLGGQA